MYVAQGIFEQFYKMLLKDVDYTTAYLPYLVADCDVTKYKSIFLYNTPTGTYLEITPENFVLQTDIGIPGYCLLAIVQNDDDYWLLGDVFIRNYYSIWDEENDQLGLAPHITSTATITLGSAPTDFLIPTYPDYTGDDDSVLPSSILDLIDFGAITFMGVTYSGLLSAFFVIVGTVFFGDFTKPVRRYAGMILHSFNKKIDPEIFTASPKVMEDDTIVTV